MSPSNEEVVFKCENCPYTSHRKHNLIRHIISKHKEESETHNPVTLKITNKPKKVIQQLESNALEESVQIQIDSVQNEENIVHLDKYRCSKCKSLFLTNKLLSKHIHMCRQKYEDINDLLTGLPLISSCHKSQTPSIVEEDSISSISELNSDIYNTDYDNKNLGIHGINIKLFTLKEKLFDIIKYIIFEQGVEDNKETEKIYKRAYKSISKCMSNILLDEQELYAFNSGTVSPRLVQPPMRRRGSWVTTN